MGTLPGEHDGMLYIDLVQAIPLLEVASEESEGFAFDEFEAFEEFPDASENCANYATQDEAQTAYDAAEPDTFDLDQDFDGEVCEDFFAVPVETPAATPEADDGMDVADALADADLSARAAVAAVSYDEDGLRRSSAILYIAE
jgi:hypothetical protein